MKNVIMSKIMFIFIVLFAFSGTVSGALNDTEAYYDFNNNSFLDSSGNSYTATNTGTINASGILLDSRDFDGTNDNLDLTFNTDINDFTISMWINSDTTDNRGYITTATNTGTDRGGFQITQLSGNIQATIWNSTGANPMDSGVAITTGTWYYITLTYDNGNSELFVNGTSKANLTNTLITSFNNTLALGQYYRTTPTSLIYDGSIDEVAIYDNVKTNSEILELYNNHSAHNPYTSPTPAIVSNITTYYSSLTNNISLTTLTNSNYSYVLNGGSEISIANNTNSTSILLTGIEALNNITWISTGINGQTNTSETFTIDITNPFLNVTSGNTFTTFIINLTTIINYSDTNIDTCILTFSNDTTNCNNESYTLTSGFHYFNVTVTDLATNSNTSLNNNLTINPYHFWYFTNSTGGAITNFSLNGTSFTNYAMFSTDDLGLGNYTFQFVKTGYGSFEFTRLINNTGTWNETINVSDATLIIKIYDRETGNLLTGLTTITLLATVGANTTTTTGLVNISDYNFISESYEILAEHGGYGSESIYFTYNNQQNFEVNIYMLNQTTIDYGTVNIILKNSLAQFIEGGVCSVLEWKPALSSFLSIAQGLTNVNGQTIFNIELGTKIYKFSCTKSGFTTTTESQIVQVDESILTIVLNDVITTPTIPFTNIVTSLTNTTINATHQLIFYDFEDMDGFVLEGCVKAYTIQGNIETLIASSVNCTSSSSGERYLTLNINNSQSIVVKGILRNAEIGSYITNEILFIGTGSIINQFKILGLNVLIPTMFTLLGLGLGFLLSDMAIGVVAMSIGVWFGTGLAPTVLSSGIATFISILTMLIIWGGFKRK